MRTRHFLPLVVVGAASFACSASSDVTIPDTGSAPVKDADAADRSSHTDAATILTGRKDTGASKDAPKEGVSDSAGDAGAPPTPVGTTIAQGDVTLFGVTSDGYVVYQSGTSVLAAPEAGGTTTVLAAGDAGSASSIYVLVSNAIVFIWTNTSTANVAALTVWSNSLGKATQVSTASFLFTAEASPDSTAIVFATDVSSTGSKGTLVGATLSALSSPSTLATDIDPGSGSCLPDINFSGAGASLYAVVGTCMAATTDGGVETQTVAAFPTSTWTGRTLATNATLFTVDSTGTSAAIELPSGLEIAPLSGATPVPIGVAPDAGVDAGVALGEFFYLSPTDSFVLFNSAAGALLSSNLLGADLVTLLGSGASGFDAVSPSESYILVDTGYDTMTYLVTGLALASTSTPNTRTTIATGDGGANEEGIFGDAFTSDSNYFLYLANVTPDEQDYDIGTLMAAAVKTPGTPITVASASGTLSAAPLDLFSGSLSNALAADAEDPMYLQSATDYALTGSKIAFVNDFNSGNGIVGQVDIDVVDLSTATAATTVMHGADPLFLVSADKKYLIYTITFGGSTDGLYTVAVP